MITVTYSDAHAKLTDILDMASEQPVMIVRSSAPDVVVISAEEYEVYRQAKFGSAMAHVGVDNHELFKALVDK